MVPPTADVVVEPGRRPDQPQRTAVPWRNGSERGEPASVYTSFVWAISLVPLLWAGALMQWDLESQVIRSIADPGVLDLSLLLVEALSLMTVLVLMLLAYLDWRQLLSDGYEDPFHWAWVFLGPAGYIVGRSVVVKRRTGRGYAPIWVFTATFGIAIWVLVDKVSAALPAVLNAIWPIA